MTRDLRSALQSHRQAVDEFLRAARAVPPTRWGEPRASGKWSPRQIAEHVALAYEVNGSVLRGGRAPFSLIGPLRPLARWLLLRPVLRWGRFFPGSKSPRAFRPSSTPAAPDQLLGRLSAAVGAFESDIAAMRKKTMRHPVFGRLRVVDYLRLQEIHTRHHGAQLRSARG